MRAAGVESIVDTDTLSILGLWEIGTALPKFLRAFRDLKRAASARRPDAVILIDWPDFNLRLARWLHRRGFRVIYYVSPQVWAWRSYRAHSIRRDVDLLLSILPFEKEWYAARGMTEVEYVGHPLVGNVKPNYGQGRVLRATQSRFLAANHQPPARQPSQRTCAHPAADAGCGREDFTDAAEHSVRSCDCPQSRPDRGATNHFTKGSWFAACELARDSSRDT